MSESGKTMVASWAEKGEANLSRATGNERPGQILAARGFDRLWAKACAAKEAFPMP